MHFKDAKAAGIIMRGQMPICTLHLQKKITVLFFAKEAGKLQSREGLECTFISVVLSVEDPTYLARHIFSVSFFFNVSL